MYTHPRMLVYANSAQKSIDILFFINKAAIKRTVCDPGCPFYLKEFVQNLSESLIDLIL